MSAPVYDLHSHSTASDGTLSPEALVERAAARGVTHLALTDHDEISGLAEARLAGERAGVEIVNGVELSAIWNGRTVHVVGLFFDATAPALRNALAGVQEMRRIRAHAIAQALASIGIGDALEGVKPFVTNESLISRSHFARFLVDRGYVNHKQNAFNRYLGRGKPAYVQPGWPSLDQAVATLLAAGGIAVLAHPGRYPLTDTAMRRLLGDFRDSGGRAIEVFSSSHTPPQNERFVERARFYGFRGSLGSDFHSPEESRIDLGGVPPLPAGLPPVWA